MSRLVTSAVLGAALSSSLWVAGANAAPAPSPSDDLPSPLALSDLLSAVRKRNPAAAEKDAMAKAAALRPRAEALPDDPMAMLEWWQQPVNFTALPIMVTVKQNIPFPGTLHLRREQAERDARPLRDDADQAVRQAEADAKRAYFDLVLAERALAVNARVRTIDARLVKVTESLYRVGRAVQADVLKAQSELLTAENERYDIERARDDAAARINALCDRPASAPVGPTATPPEVVTLPAETDLVERAAANRPEVRRARDRLAAAETRVALSRRASYPELAGWASYMRMFGGVDTFTVGVSSTLPIFSTRRRRPLVGAAELEVEGARRAIEAAQRETELFVRTALLQLETAARHVRLHGDKLVPLADLALESAEAAYQSGRLDFTSVLEAARMVRDHHLNHVRFLVEFERRRADLELVLGTDLVRPAERGGEK